MIQMCRMKNIVGILLCLFVSTFFSKSMAQDYVVVARQKLKTDKISLISLP